MEVIHLYKNIEQLIAALKDSNAYVTITFLPGAGFDVYVSWWGGIDWNIRFAGDTLKHLLLEAVDKVTAFLAGDKTGWKPDEPIEVVDLAEGFQMARDEESDACSILK